MACLSIQNPPTHLTTRRWQADGSYHIWWAEGDEIGKKGQHLYKFQHCCEVERLDQRRKFRLETALKMQRY